MTDQNMIGGNKKFFADRLQNRFMSFVLIFSLIQSHFRL